MLEKRARLRDGREVIVRLMRPDDTERSYQFFAALPADDRRYLRADVTRRDVVERRAHEIDTDRIVRLVAVDGEAIVADGTLELAGHGWGDNIGEIRLIVARPYQRLGLGTILARELYFLAAERKLHRIVVRMMRPQKGARRIFRQLGFKDEYLIPEHVRDQDGTWQDLIIMRCNLEDLWAELEGSVTSADINRYR